MQTDPTLARLVAAAAAATAAVQTYIETGFAEPDDDLVEPQAAEERYKISSDTRVRWAKNDNLGVKTERGWCLYASLVFKHKGR